MATYISPSFQGSDYVSGVPIDLVAQVAGSKQQQYDYNRYIIQQQINAIDPNQIQKESDRAYIASRLQDTVSELNKYGTGYDLSDSRVNSKLQGILAGLKADPSLYSRINANKRFSDSMAELARIKKDKPELYNSANEAYFINKAQAWLNNPDQIDFNETYIPYYNKNEIFNDIGEQMSKNPEILYLPDGTKRGEREVKMLTKEKVQEAFLNKVQSDPALARQMQIEYEVGRGNLSMQSALNELASNKKYYTDQLKQVQDNLSSITSDNPQYNDMQNQAAELTKQLNNAISAIDGKYNEVVTTQDPSRYYNFNKYIQDTIDNEAGRWAYRQEGKIDWDPYMLESFKTDQQLKVEDFRLKGDLLKQERKNALDTAKNGSSNVEGYNIPNGFANTIADIYEFGEGSFNNDMMQSMLSNAGNVDDNGYMTFTPSKQDKIFIDIGPTIETLFNTPQGNQYNINKKRATGMQSLNDAYDNYLKKNNIKFENFLGSGISEPAYRTKSDKGYDVLYTKSQMFNEFLKTPEGKAASENTKREFGFDTSNPKDKEAVNIFQKQLASDEAMNLLGTMLGDKSILSGNIKVTSKSGKNAISTSDGSLYLNLLAQVPQSKLEAVFGTGGLFGSGTGFQPLIDKGLIIDTGETVKNADGDIEKVYQVPLSVKSSKPLNQANQDYGVNHIFSPSEYTKNAQGWDKSFNDMRNDFLSNPKTDVSSLKGRAFLKVTEMFNEREIPENIKNQALQDIDFYSEKANSYAVSAKDRMQARKALNAIINHSSSVMNDQEFSEASNLPSEARALLDAIADAEGGKYNILYGGKTFSGNVHPNIKVPITTGPNAGKTSSAAGRYQFLNSTWNKYKNLLNLQDFSPESQDTAAWQLAQDTYRDNGGGDLLRALQSGTFNPKLLGSTWEGLPGGGRPQRTTEQVKKYIQNRINNINS